MSVPGEGRAGALIAAASRRSPIKRQSAGGAARPSALQPRRDEPEVLELLPAGCPFQRVLLSRHRRLCCCPGCRAFVSTEQRTGSRFCLPRLGRRCAMELRCQPRWQGSIRPSAAALWPCSV